jgi:hypothetical protein
MPTLKQLLFAPILGGSVAFACGGEARPAAADSAPRRVATPAAPVKKNCPDQAYVSSVLGGKVTLTGQGIGCMYVTDDESYGADMILSGAATGARLMNEVREEAQGRQIRTESPGVGDDGVLFAGQGNAAGAVVGNAKSAYVDVTMHGKDASATKAALITLLRKGIE